MANIKSQIKRNKQNEHRRVANRVFRGQARTFVSKARTAIAKGADDTQEAVREAISMLDHAAAKGRESRIVEFGKCLVHISSNP